ncbi:MAG: ATP-binding protein [archaeon]
MKFFKVIEKTSAKLKDPLSFIVRVVLVLSIVNFIYHQSWHLLFVNILLLGLILLPFFMQRNYSIHIPGEFEFIILMFIIISFFLGEIRGLFIQIFLGAAIGFVGYMLIFILYTNNKIRTNYSFVALFSFSFAVTIGAMMEILKYILKYFLGFEFNVSNYLFTIQSLTLVALGAFFVSTLCYVFMKHKKIKAMRYFITKFVKRNPALFVKQTDSPEELLKLISKGENKNLEFKSTLRTNLHNNEIDKRIEYSILKTIVAFLNSNGGTLLIGVSDKGEITGIEKDNFPDNDKFNLHFANLIKQYIGKKYLPFLSFEIIQVEDRNIMKVECLESDKPVFLKIDGREEFYTRSGSASTPLEGSELLGYIEHKFKNK